MRRIVVTEFVTVDGVFEDPGGSEGTKQGGWNFKFFGEEDVKFKAEELFPAGALLLGRVTYQGFADAWPDRSDELGFADKMNSLPKYVVSNTLELADWEHSTIIRGDIAGQIRKLKEGSGGDILVYGSARLVHFLLAEGLIDQLDLMVQPIVVGEGKKLFPDGTATTTMKLVKTRVHNTGNVVLTYEPQKD